jgi:hypothetical protein
MLFQVILSPDCSEGIAVHFDYFAQLQMPSRDILECFVTLCIPIGAGAIDVLLGY